MQCDLLCEGPEILIPMKDLFLSIKKSFELLIFWIKPRNRNIIIPSGIENSYHSNFLVLKDIRG